MNNESTWLRPRAFVLAIAAFWCFWLSLAVMGLFGVWVDGAPMPVFSARVLAHVTLQSVPLGIATPILLHLGARFALLPPHRRSWLRPGLWVVVCATAHALVFTAFHWASEGNWLIVATGLLSWGLPYSCLAAISVALGQQRVGERRERELLAAQLRALRSQLQPHFLFNSLQAIAATARRDADAAVRMTALLGDLLRQTLRERSGELVTLADERDLLQPYLELQRLRFGERLTIAVDLPTETLDAEVPDLLLQPLVENALCHGIEKLTGAGTVAIRARRDGSMLELQVADDGAGQPHDAADGIGLGATRARLAALFGDRAELRLAPGGVRGTVVTLRLPFRQVTRAA